MSSSRTLPTQNIDLTFQTPVKEDQFPEAFRNFLLENEIDFEVYNRAHLLPRFIRVNPQDGVTLSQLEAELNTPIEKVSWLPDFFKLDSSVKISGSSLYKQGLLYGIDVSSGAAIHILNPKPGDHCLDLCCAPGAKLAMLANLVAAHDSDAVSGSVTGVDISKPRLSSCRSISQKYKLSNLRLFHVDGTIFNVGPFGPLLEGKDQPVPFYENEFYPLPPNPKCMNSNLYDKVIVDAECTHDGSLKHILKYHKWGWSLLEKKFLDPERLESLVELQRRLLENGYRLLKIGGDLVYSTCSFSRKQNEDIIIWFLEKYPDAILLDPNTPDYPVKLPLESCQRLKIRGIERTDIKFMVRFDPLISETSGLFVAKIRKHSSCVDCLFPLSCPNIIIDCVHPHASLHPC